MIYIQLTIVHIYFSYMKHYVEKLSPKCTSLVIMDRRPIAKEDNKFVIFSVEEPCA